MGMLNRKKEQKTHEFCCPWAWTPGPCLLGGVALCGRVCPWLNEAPTLGPSCELHVNWSVLHSIYQKNSSDIKDVSYFHFFKHVYIIISLYENAVRWAWEGLCLHLTEKETGIQRLYNLVSMECWVVNPCLSFLMCKILMTISFKS